MAVKTKISYRDAISEIETTIACIENDELDVDELSQKVKRVSELLVICKDKLHSTEKEVEKILNEMNE
jgi:exodeoxyribonuclease VII small subunit